MKKTFKLGDKILNKLADVLLTKVVKEDYELRITVKAKKGESNDENCKSSKSRK